MKSIEIDVSIENSFIHPRTNCIMILLRITNIFLSTLTIVFLKKYSNQSKCQHVLKETHKFKVVSNSHKVNTHYVNYWHLKQCNSDNERKM